MVWRCGIDLFAYALGSVMGFWDISCPQQTATSFSKENYCILFRGVSRETCNMVAYWKMAKNRGRSPTVTQLWETWMDGWWWWQWIKYRRVKYSSLLCCRDWYMNINVWGSLLRSSLSSPVLPTTDTKSQGLVSQYTINSISTTVRTSDHSAYKISSPSSQMWQDDTWTCCQ